ncbi:S24 family peptidase [Pedobacter sp. ASV28]|jgi:Peptidase S24-like/Bacteriophage CI repressor helix-turn-helix domain|uniref:LexA family transcriptional regulator n=1 Tax=Pedobacter sp. ASV28 TaxID=2795123 RepID=UPI0018EAF9B1|nr:S24 family peptidase [Pedobacter sp. ASV28]
MGIEKDNRLILNEIKSHYNFSSDAELARFLGVAPNTLSNWVARNSLDYDLIFSKCEDIDANFLLTGKGNRWKANIDYSVSNLAEPKSVYMGRTDIPQPLQMIPLYDFRASAGLVALFNERNNVLDHIKIPNLPKSDGAISIVGDSMYPLLKSGDIVIYKIVQNVLDNIFWGEMYLLSYAYDGDEMITVKYVQKSEKGEQYIKLVSQNSYHQPKDIKIECITGLALIKASIRINNMS